MPEWDAKILKRHTARLSEAFRGASTRKKAAVAFAKKHDLIYFETVHPDGHDAPDIRSTSTSTDQVDMNYCIGSHADYDLTVMERLSSVKFEGYKTTIHRWYVLQIDLKHARALPFLFLGTKQQTKAYYAKVLMTHREATYISLPSLSDKASAFHATYALITSPSNVHMVNTLFTDDIIEAMAARKYPFAVEFEGDSLVVMTDAQKPSEQLLDKLLHYGLWMAKTIDARLV